MPIVSRRSRPKFWSLKERILNDLSEGQYCQGEPLPSENELAESMGMSRSTVRLALGELENEGVVRRIKGKGTFVNMDQRIRHNGRPQLQAYALILPELRTGLYTSLIEGFDHKASTIHHQVMVCDTCNDVGRQADVILQMIDQNIAGVVLVPTSIPPTPIHQVRQLQSQSIPFIFCDRKVEGISVPFVSWYWEEVGRIAGQAFVERGHRRIAYFGGCLGQNYPMTDAYEKGLREVLEGAGLSLPAERVFARSVGSFEEADFVEDDLKYLREAFESADRPTAILCESFVIGEYVHCLARQMGIKVPEELSIVGFDDQSYNGVFGKILSCVVINEFEVGERAAGLLYELQTGQRPLNSNEEILLPLALEERQTLGPVPH